MFRKIFIAALILTGFLFWVKGSLAGIDKPPQQVTIEAKIVECKNSSDQALFTKNVTGGVNTEIGLVLKQCGPCNTDESCREGETAANAGYPGQILLEVSILSRGQGIGGRDWIPEKPMLKIGGERVRPVSQQNYYVNKESVAQGAAGLIFAAIGSQYEEIGRTAGATEGKVCPVTGQKLEGGEAERSDLQKGIDRAGMAAGLGLIASQAKGQITGLRVTFDITDKINLVLVPETTMVLQTNLHNTSTEKNVYLSNVPVIGFLFKQKTGDDKKEPLIFITPQVIK